MEIEQGLCASLTLLSDSRSQPRLRGLQEETASYFNLSAGGSGEIKMKKRESL